MLRFPADALLASSRDFPGRLSQEIDRICLAKMTQELSSGIMELPHIAAKFFPYAGDSPSYTVCKVESPASNNTVAASEPLAIPPKELWEGYGETHEEYLHQGKSHTAAMRELLKTWSFPIEKCHRILDFGCASGRMIRWLNDLSAEREIWGLDINEQHILWCQQHLSPPFKFAATTTFPHLPFEDKYFDFIYSGSVFTHISELTDAWLLELKRIVCPGGRLYITVHDKHFLGLLLKKLPESRLTKLVLHFDSQSHFIGSDFAMCTVCRSPYAQVFYDIDYLCQRWGQILKVVSVTQEAYGYQTAILLEK